MVCFHLETGGKGSWSLGRETGLQRFVGYQQKSWTILVGWASPSLSRHLFLDEFAIRQIPSSTAVISLPGCTGNGSTNPFEHMCPMKILCFVCVGVHQILSKWVGTCPKIIVKDSKLVSAVFSLHPKVIAIFGWNDEILQTCSVTILILIILPKTGMGSYQKAVSLHMYGH